MAWILFLARIANRDYVRRALKSKIAQLLVIPYSHFCELAAWSLEIAGIPFEIHGFAPAQHILASLSVRYARKQVKKISPSEDTPTSTQVSGKHKSSSTSLPVLVTPEGRVLTDSWAIATHAGLPPIDDKMQQIYDQELGPLARKFAYYYILKPSNRNIWNGVCTTNFGWVWAALWYLGFGAQVTKLMTRSFECDKEDAFLECKSKLTSLIASLGQRIRDRTGRYLGGDNLSLEDIALAALAAPLVMPPEYCKGPYRRWFDALEAQDQSHAAELAHWRSTDVGQYTLAIYSQHRIIQSRNPRLDAAKFETSS